MPPTTENKGALAQARQDARAERKALAPPPGEAKTLEEVLLRSGDRPDSQVAASRVAVLAALIKAGGEVRDTSGKGGATGMLAALMKNKPNPNLLRDMEADKQIGREKPTEKSKRTTAIFLLDPIAKPKPPKQEIVKAEVVTGKRRGRPPKVQPSLPVEVPTEAIPTLGTMWRVAMTMQDDDGTVRIGWRNNGSMVVTVLQSYARGH